MSEPKLSYVDIDHRIKDAVVQFARRELIDPNVLVIGHSVRAQLLRNHYLDYRHDSQNKDFYLGMRVAVTNVEDEVFVAWRPE